jgi:Transcriptional regulator
MAKKKETKRTIQGRQTRQKLFDTSMALFSKHGYDKVTIDDICDKIGVSKGALYTHFESKDQILVENFMTVYDYYDEISGDLASLKSSLEKLDAFNTYAMSKMKKVGLLSVKRSYHTEISPGKKKSFLISKNTSLYKIMNSIIVEGQKNGEIRNDMSADAIVTFLIQLARGLIFEWCLNNGSFDLVESSKKIAPIVLEGIKYQQ